MASSLAMGVIAGKIVADILFYLMADASYELLRRRWGHVEHMTRS
jgi:hypothetical protein